MYRLLFLVLLFSCAKEECKQCFHIIESNEAQAILKCNGLANNYPNVDYGETFAGTLCGDEIENFTDGGRSKHQQAIQNASKLSGLDIKFADNKLFFNILVSL